jgi:5-formyltetrahydrofolate cyclo-ligase
MTDKAELRASMRTLRKRLAQAAPDAALRLADHAERLLDHEWAVEGRWADDRARGRRLTVAIYSPRGAEIDPGPLGRALIALSCDLCLPVVDERDAPLIFRRWTPGQALAPDLAGSAAPLADAPVVRPAMILCPLLAFDAFGGRLGQGGGYYDRTVAAMDNRVAFIGVAYAGQEADRLPVEDHDETMNGVLTETGYRPLGISR